MTDLTAPSSPSGRLPAQRPGERPALRQPAPGPAIDREARSDWLRLRTLVILRWLAAGGQLSAVLVASLVLELQFNIALCLVVIAALVVVNIAAVLTYPRNRRLSEGEALTMLLFDLVQLMAMIVLTGGLNNPFVVMLLAPVTIAATALRPGSVLVMNLAAIALITLAALAYQPVLGASGAPLLMPELFAKGMWIALVVAVAFISVYTRRVTLETHAMQQALTATQLALGREQRLTALGGVVAAAAHELGTPLATIKLAATELAEELQDNPELANDAILIRDQADRCRDILRGMGRAAGTEDEMLRRGPAGAVVREAAEPHARRGRTLVFRESALPGAALRQPVIPRAPEIVHGLRNIVQNAVDHAVAQVEIDVEWSEDVLCVRVCDDGPGFAPDLIARVGDPFLRRRAEGLRPDLRLQPPRSEGVGLGLFIAKTLLERSGAEVIVANAEEGAAMGGAMVEVIWPLSQLDTGPEAAPAA
ncbi:MAG: ActS/PrrB/RegB family redox-sensitive histidine kinase [Rhodobacteraceae bacterium]|nr:ActS/PrrB/RegB family redox-sensitive histidine kinase [Paracoccaceae bacterium]